MRKVAFPVAALATMLVMATVALAQAGQVNLYSVGGLVSGGQGSKKVPRTVGVSFDYQVGEASGQRPSPVKRYTIDLYGVRAVNGARFPSCSADKINAGKSDRSCPKGSLVGSGSIVNAAGASTNPSDKSIPCNATIKIYNSGAKKGALFIKGGPSGTGASKCAIDLAQAIPVKYVTGSGGGTALQFDVPSGLLHPVPGVDNAVVSVKSTIKKLKVRKSGKNYGYYESVGCKGSTRPIKVTFTAETGQRKSASKSTKC